MRFENSKFESVVGIGEDRFIHPKGYNILVPASDVTVNFTRSGADTNFDCINEYPTPDDATSYVRKQNTTYQSDIYGMTKPATLFPNTSLISLQIGARVYSPSYNAYVNVGYKIGETSYLSAIVTNLKLTSYTTYYSSLSTANPATSAPWTIDEVNNLNVELQMKSAHSTGYVYCSQLFVIFQVCPFATIFRSGGDLLVASLSDTKKIALTEVE